MNKFTINPNAVIHRLDISDGEYYWVVDDFFLEPEQLVSYAGDHADKFKLQDSGYPGSLFIPENSKAVDIQQFFRNTLSRQMGFCRAGVNLASVFSMVTKSADQLNWAQRLCHTDPPTEAGKINIAGLVYLFADERLGGTGFYHFRNRELLEQATDIARRSMDSALTFLQQKLPIFRQPACYLTDSCDVAELRALAQAKFNRAIFYSGDIPHSAFIDSPELLSNDIYKGRLTLNFFASAIAK